MIEYEKKVILQRNWIINPEPYYKKYNTVSYRTRRFDSKTERVHYKSTALHVGLDGINESVTEQIDSNIIRNNYRLSC